MHLLHFVQKENGAGDLLSTSCQNGIMTEEKHREVLISIRIQILLTGLECHRTI